MDTQIIVVFFLSDDMLPALHHHEDKQRQMSDAEIMTTAIVAMLDFKGNFCLASRFLYEGNYIPGMLSKSRFNRRPHAISDLFLTLFLRLGETWKQLNENSIYVIDSYPIAVCAIIAFDAQKSTRMKIVESIFRARNATFMVCASTLWSPNMANPLNSFLLPVP